MEFFVRPNGTMLSKRLLKRNGDEKNSVVGQGLFQVLLWGEMQRSRSCLGGRFSGDVWLE